MKSVDWIYLLTEREGYPEPNYEVQELHQLENQGHQISIMLTDQKSPPLSGGEVGQWIAFCRRERDRLAVLSTCRIAGSAFPGVTPDHLRSLYGKHETRSFLPVSGLTLENDELLDESILPINDQRTFLSGQAYVKRFTKKSPSQEKPR